MMRRRLAPALLAWILAASLPAAATAQCPPPPPTSPLAPGEIGLFFDPLGTVTCGNVVVGGTTPLYVVARVPDGGIARFEIPELLADTLPPGMMILFPTLPPGTPYDFHVFADACHEAVRKNPSVCPVVPGDLLVIAMVPVMALLPVNGAVCFQTACPTIAGTFPRDPLHYRCDTGVPAAFTGGERMCVVFGQPPLTVDTATWGEVKSLYRGD